MEINSISSSPAVGSFLRERTAPNGTEKTQGGETEETPKGAKKGNPSAQGLTPEEKKEVERLKSRDREVRAHEQAHKAAAGPIATGGPTFEFKQGPDGRQYAVEGEVQLDVSETPNNPEAAIRKAQIIRRAALAPAEPSAQDRRVAAEAAAMEARARQKLVQERAEKTKERTTSDSGNETGRLETGNTAETSEAQPANRKNTAEKQNALDPAISRKIERFSNDLISESGQLLDFFA
ncbi:MAG: putative metalloprotease CJM1_0395 family protein [Nitrospinales bacterium]